jgi:hypothetical protein
LISDLNFKLYLDSRLEREKKDKMTVLKATIRVLTLLALTITLASPYPVGRPQTAENKGRGRSYPLIISHYSNVRNSKYDSPPATEATTTTTSTTTTPTTTAAAESTDLKEKVEDVDDKKASASLVNTDEAQPAGDAGDESKSQQQKVDDEAAAATTSAAPNMEAADSASVARNESISVTTQAVPAATPEDSLLVSKVSLKAANSKNLNSFKCQTSFVQLLFFEIDRPQKKKSSRWRSPSKKSRKRSPSRREQ